MRGCVFNHPSFTFTSFTSFTYIFPKTWEVFYLFLKSYIDPQMLIFLQYTCVHVKSLSKFLAQQIFSTLKMFLFSYVIKIKVENIVQTRCLYGKPCINLCPIS